MAPVSVKMQWLVVNSLVKTSIQNTLTNRRFPKPLEINNALVFLKKPKYVNSFASIENKIILNGTAGNRAFDKYTKQNKEQAKDPEQNWVTYFSELQKDLHSKPIQVIDFLSEYEFLPFTIETRNLFNCYHFLTETLMQFCLIDFT